MLGWFQLGLFFQLLLLAKTLLVFYFVLFGNAADLVLSARIQKVIGTSII
jgi:hypothetical protein